MRSSARAVAGWPGGGRVDEAAIRAIDEGRADHAAGRTFALAEIKREFGIDS